MIFDDNAWILSYELKLLVINKNYNFILDNSKLTNMSEQKQEGIDTEISDVIFIINRIYAIKCFF